MLSVTRVLKWRTASGDFHFAKKDERGAFRRNGLKLALLFFCPVLLVKIPPAWASDDTCDATLTHTVISSSTFDSRDIRTAVLLSETDWQNLQTSEGANGVYDGITLGATYGEFQNNVKSTLATYNVSENTVVARNIFWDGLSDASSDAYQACIDSKVLLQDGSLHLAVVSATATDVTMLLQYSLVGDGPRQVDVKWHYNGPQSDLPTVVFSGPPTRVTVLRPTVEETINVNSVAPTGGYGGDSVTLTPIPTPIFLPPKPPPPASLPVYRFNVPGFGGGIRGYYFAMNMFDGQNLHYNFEKIAFRVLANPQPGTVKLFQCRVRGADYAASIGGDSCPGNIEDTISLLGYVFDTKYDGEQYGAMPLTYCWNKVKGYHLITTDSDNDCVAQGGLDEVTPYGFVLPP